MAVTREVHPRRPARLPKWAVEKAVKILGPTLKALIADADELGVDLDRASVVSVTCDCGAWLATEYEDRGRTVGVVNLHCSSCHADDDHAACELCGECISPWSAGRSPRPAYHGACRSRAYRARQREAA
jgi:hypothetical protein